MTYFLLKYRAYLNKKSIVYVLVCLLYTYYMYMMYVYVYIHSYNNNPQYDMYIKI